MKIIVVGGGVVGASIAWHLARESAGEVTLLERDRLGSGTTWHSAGNITWKPLPDHDAQIVYALETIPRVEAESGRATGWLRTGRTFVARSERSLADFAEFDRAARERGIAARWLEPDETRRLNPLLDPAAARGIWLNPLSGRVNPADLTAAYAGAARSPAEAWSASRPPRGGWRPISSWSPPGCGRGTSWRGSGSPSRNGRAG